MACASGAGQSCTDCRMCRGRTLGKENKNVECETVSVQQSSLDQHQNWDIPGQISIDEYLQSLK